MPPLSTQLSRLSRRQMAPLLRFRPKSSQRSPASLPTSSNGSLTLTLKAKSSRACDSDTPSSACLWTTSMPSQSTRETSTLMLVLCEFERVLRFGTTKSLRSSSVSRPFSAAPSRLLSSVVTSGAFLTNGCVAGIRRSSSSRLARAQAPKAPCTAAPGSQSTVSYAP